MDRHADPGSGAPPRGGSHPPGATQARATVNSPKVAAVVGPIAAYAVSNSITISATNRPRDRSATISASRRARSSPVIGARLLERSCPRVIGQDPSLFTGHFNRVDVRHVLHSHAGCSRSAWRRARSSDPKRGGWRVALGRAATSSASWTPERPAPSPVTGLAAALDCHEGGPPLVTRSGCHRGASSKEARLQCCTPDWISVDARSTSVF